MTKKQLLLCSGIRDFLDLIGIGQIPGLNWVLDVPMFILHFQYAGPMALFTLLEAVPVVGFAPIWTAAALCYPDFEKERAQTVTDAPKIQQQLTKAQEIKIDELSQGDWIVLDDAPVLEDAPRRRVTSHVIKQLPVSSGWRK